MGMLNKHFLSVPLVMIILFYWKGGLFASLLLKSSNYIDFLEMNKLTLAYYGIDLSLLPSCILLMTIYFCAYSVVILIEYSVEFYVLLTKSPAADINHKESMSEELKQPELKEETKDA